ncbi:unnamed protein product [Sphagnum jensenii]|uniref:Uncharacterized protein n=1 Tax=Sphagnum jensenii TaxID=128206 RepID=A0ABP1BVS2_9BRYO
MTGFGHFSTVVSDIIRFSRHWMRPFLSRRISYPPVLKLLDAAISRPSHLISSGSQWREVGGTKGSNFCELGLQKERHVSHAQKAANLASLPTQGQESKDLGGSLYYCSLQMDST